MSILVVLIFLIFRVNSLDLEVDNKLYGVFNITSV